MQPSPAKSLLAQAIAIAACAFSLPALAEGATEILMQLTPAGEFRASDGREIPSGAWRIDGQIAGRVIGEFNARANPLVLDYEHQTLHKETNGQPAPAAGWLRELVWIDGKGLFARVELTARAQSLIRAGEYRYVSPVFLYHKTTGEVLAIEMAALTNNPAIDGMEPLVLRAAATFGRIPSETPAMNKLLLALIASLNLRPDSTEDEAAAACSAKLDELANLRRALDVPEAASSVAALAHCTALRTKADAPDPAKFVPASVVEELKGQIAALSAKTAEREVGELVEAGLADGRLLPAQKEWATALGKGNLAALTAYLAATPAIAALSGSQTRGRAPESTATNPHALTETELAICAATGTTPEAFAKAK
ncbi:MAG: phage protease [Lysobacterales bacterium]